MSSILQTRYEEYYNLQTTFDELFKKSKNNQMDGLNILKIIKSEENIMLAYRTIKSNTGSKTRGTDGLTIDDYKIMDNEKFIRKIRYRLRDYKPQSVRRVEIPKDNGKTRPLGIPTMEDRLIQQMFKQVLEPICEAKFYNHSYGFRPNRNQHHAIARCNHTINRGKLYHVVDVDIKGFFDNVNHNKLIKQCYNIGIRDKRVLKVIREMLKAPIEGIGVPERGTPQGGILSPLLSNITLNEIDWWVSEQWESFESKYKYVHNRNKYKILKDTRLKPMFIVRFADDFKIFTNTRENAKKIFYAVKKQLNKKLKLEISEEKSKITNLNEEYTEFLGFKVKAIKKGKKKISYSYLSDKSKSKIKKKLKEQIKICSKQPTIENARKLNSMILGIHNYYKKATNSSADFNKIAFQLSRLMYNRFKRIAKYERPKEASEIYYKLYGKSYKTYKINGVWLYPIAKRRHVIQRSFSQDICNYTSFGREKNNKMNLKTQIAVEINNLLKIAKNIDNVEYWDNRISRYSMQNGKCYITGKFLLAEEMHCHHKIPKKSKGNDSVSNLIIVDKMVHKLIHAVDLKTVKNYLEDLKLNQKAITRINNLRKICKLDKI